MRLARKFARRAGEAVQACDQKHVSGLKPTRITLASSERGAAPSHLARTALRSAQHEIFAAVAPSPLFPDRDDLQPCALQFRTKQRLTRLIKAEHDNTTDRKTPFHIYKE